eukprot:TRINITY_DN66427_c7_g3_i1.p1 TRINITY_DN66427_c7_g3~~TRINITY_DN66427_c7_g3_i1.p1  ORF type:complete len:605 (-),score=74.89 TRINITY_DN66427_c7_g3_i1:102-1916(-)
MSSGTASPVSALQEHKATTFSTGNPSLERLEGDLVMTDTPTPLLCIDGISHNFPVSDVYSSVLQQEKNVVHIRMVVGSDIESYMLLVLFDSEIEASEFKAEYHDKPLSSLISPDPVKVNFVQTITLLSPAAVRRRQQKAEKGTNEASASPTGSSSTGDDSINQTSSSTSSTSDDEDPANENELEEIFDEATSSSDCVRIETTTSAISNHPATFLQLNYSQRPTPDVACPICWESLFGEPSTPLTTPLQKPREGATTPTTPLQGPVPMPPPAALSLPPTTPVSSSPVGPAPAADQLSRGGTTPTPPNVSFGATPVCRQRSGLSTDLVAALVTTACNHTFHVHCLFNCPDSICPVCRYHYHESTTECLDCNVTTGLWMCLICGNVGCGRYSNHAHAVEHFAQTGHSYAMELDTRKVWDYSGDGYVQRLLYNSTDGKLVELGTELNPSKHRTLDEAEEAEVDAKYESKVEMVYAKFDKLLQNQLQAQKDHFEKLIQDEEEACKHQIAELEGKKKQIIAENLQLEAQLDDLQKSLKGRTKSEKTVETENTHVSEQVEVEVQMGKMLKDNIARLEAQIERLTAEQEAPMKEEMELKALEEKMNAMMVGA